MKPLACAIVLTLLALPGGSRAAAEEPSHPRVLLAPGAGAIDDLSVSADGSLFAVAGGDGVVRLLGPDGAARAALQRSGAALRCVAFSADAARLTAAYADGAVAQWEVVSRRVLSEVRLKTADLGAVAVAPDGRTFAAGDDNGAVTLRDTGSGTVLRRFRVDPEAAPPGRAGGPVRELAFSPDGRLLASALDEGSRFVHVWDAAGGREVARLAEDRAGRLVFSPDGATLATGRAGGSWLTLWETASWRLRRQTFRADAGQPAAFSPDCRTLLTLSRTGPVLWDLPTLAVRRLTGAHATRVTSAAFLPGGARLLAGGADGMAAVWDLAHDADTPDPDPPPESRPESFWSALAAEDAGMAYEAIWGMAAIPAEAVPYLRNRLHPETPVDDGKLRQSIDQLDADAFTDRERATHELAEAGEAAEPFLRQRLADHPTPEAAQRIELLLGASSNSQVDSEKLRAIRAVEVLERIGTPDARAVLKELSAGGPGAVSRRAATALHRLGQSAPRAQ